jgi:hypothetical protein
LNIDIHWYSRTVMREHELTRTWGSPSWAPGLLTNGVCGGCLYF